MSLPLVTVALAATALVSTPSVTAKVSATYSQTNVASAGVAPYTYSLTSGALPSGTLLDTGTGTVSGVPTTAGAFSYRITAVDSTVPTAQTAANLVSGTIAKGDNTITFPTLPDTAFNGTPPIPAATASSGLAVTYNSLSTAVCNSTSTGEITILALGQCSIRATQAGNANYAAATQVTRRFDVVQGTNVITFPVLSATPFTSNPPTPAATSTSGLAVEYASTTPAICTVTTTGTISFVAVGQCTIRATQPGNVNYAAAAAVNRSFQVQQGANVITFPALSPTPFTSTPPTPAATSTSGLAVTYTSTTQGNCTVTSAGAITFVSTGQCTIRASQAGNATYVAATAVNRSFQIQQGINVITFPVLPDTIFTSAPPTPSATASSGLPITYNSTSPAVCTATSAGAITFVTAGQCAIRATQAGDDNHVAATAVVRRFQIQAGGNVITFPALAATRFSDPPPTPVATASSNLAVTYTSNTASICTTTPEGVITFVSVGQCAIVAAQAGDESYDAATPITRRFQIQPGANVITFQAIAATPFTGPAPTPVAAATSGLAVTFSSNTTSVCTTTSGGSITFVSTGQCSIAASQGGNANFAAATSVSQSFDVQPGINTITFPPLVDTPFTNAPPTPGATADSGLAVAYASTTTSVCTVTSTGAITFVSAGQCSVTASQSGNGNFAAATPVSQSFQVQQGANTITFPALADTPFTDTPPSPGATASSGLAVTYASATTTVCTISPTGAISFVAAGQCSITASQAGNGNFFAAIDVQQNFQVLPGANVITFPTLADTQLTGQPPVPAATASSGLPVSYSSATTAICTTTTTGVITFVAAGQCSITAAQPGNGNFVAAADVMRSFAVTAGATTTSIVTSQSPSVFGAPVTFTVTVAASCACSVAPTGTISFRNNGAEIGTAALGSGTATLTTASLPVGTNVIAADYGGDGNFGGSSGTLAGGQLVNVAATTTTIASSKNPSRVGDAVVFTATVSAPTAAGSSSVPSGSVAFSDGTTVLGTVSVSNGVATLTAASLSVGPHLISASYAGDGSFAPSATSELTQTVDEINGSVVIQMRGNMPDGSHLLTSSTPALNLAVQTVDGSGEAAAPSVLAGLHTIAVDDQRGQGIAIASIGCNDNDSAGDPSTGTISVNLAAGETVVCTVTKIDTRSQAVDMIETFQAERASMILSSLPDSQRRIDRLNGTVSAMPSPGSALMNFLPGLDTSKRFSASASLAQFNRLAGNVVDSRFDIWASGTYAAIEGSLGEGNFGLGSFGADYLVNSNLLLGGFVQMDRLSYEKIGSSISGTGWMAGPYATARVMPHLFVDVVAAAGKSSNTINPFGTYSDEFSSTRWLVNATVTGQWTYDAWTFSPGARLGYFSEKSEAYADWLGVEIPGVETGLGQFALSPEISYRFVTDGDLAIDTRLKAEAIFNFGNAADNTGFGRARGKVEAGVDFSTASGVRVGISTGYDGIGSPDLAAISGTISLSVLLK